MSLGLTPSSFSYFLVFCASMTFSPGPMTLLLLSLGLRAGLRQSLPACHACVTASARRSACMKAPRGSAVSPIFRCAKG